MPDDPMTLVERLRNPAWIHSHVSVMADAELDKEQTLEDLGAAAYEIERLRAALADIVKNSERHDCTELTLLVGCRMIAEKALAPNEE